MKYNCLIVDDEKVLADSTAEYFNFFGVKSVVAYNADDCRKFFKDNTTELILLDMNLDDKSGCGFVFHFLCGCGYGAYTVVLRHSVFVIS